MALKDWKKYGGYWIHEQYPHESNHIFIDMSPNKTYHVIVSIHYPIKLKFSKTCKTKSAALAYAKLYMRKF